MAIHDMRSQRLFVDQDLRQGASLELDRNQVNYLLNVLRINDGAIIRVFNGRDGEWSARVAIESRKRCHLVLEKPTKPQTKPKPFHYLFAPLKQGRLDYLVQKAVEMGVSHLQPVITERTQVRKVNEKRLVANAIEAAEQCGILHIPEIGDPFGLKDLYSHYGDDFTLVFCDEMASPHQNISKLEHAVVLKPALLIGPEGGFTEAERNEILQMPNVVALNLGPRILRADTAAVAAMALIQSVAGDWYTNR